MLKKAMTYRSHSKGSPLGFLGYLGDSTSHSDYKVGDVVVYKNEYQNGKLTKGIIVKDSRDSDFLMGLGGTSIKTLVSKMEVVKVLSFKHLTDEICESVNEALEVEEVDIVELTHSEIENRLGYKIKIVS